MKKPKVFANTIDKKIGHNQEFFDSSNTTVFNNIQDNSTSGYLYDEDKDYSNLTVEEKLDKLFARNGYIFNVDVIIVTKEKKYCTKIAGKVNNYLITLDNDVINIDDIIELEIK